MAKKKKKTKKNVHHINELHEEVQEELVALQAIFGEDLTVHDDQKGFSLRVVPHPGEAEVNHVSVIINITFPKQYPEEELHLKLTEPIGLQDSHVKSISKALHNAAYSYSVSASVCCFQLIQLCQELLQDLNQPPQESDVVPESLWHTMQQRELADGADGGNSSPHASPTADTWAAGDGTNFDWLNSTSTHSVSIGGVPSNGRMEPHNAAAAEGGAVHAGKQRATPKHHHSAKHPSPFKDTTTVAATAAVHDGGGAEEKVPASNAAALPSARYSSDTSSTLPSASGGASQGSLLDPTSSSLGQSFSTMLRGIGRALFPRSLQAYVKTGAETQAGDDDNNASTDDEQGDADVPSLDEQDQLRKELLLGHLIRRAAADERSLTGISAMLQQRGLVPQWLYWTLTQQPKLFDRAFKRVFKRELLEDGSSGGSGVGGKFWQPQKPPRIASPVLGGANAQVTTLSSRYKADFSEERVLGKGGYGLVFLATNRFDGLQYAIKKIPLSAATPHSYARIMREVTTLSRLHHPNIVRYYNSWMEEEIIEPRRNRKHNGGPGDSTTGYMYDDTDSNGLTESNTEVTPNLYPSQSAKSKNTLSPLSEESEEDDNDEQEESKDESSAGGTAVITVGNNSAEDSLGIDFDHGLDSTTSDAFTFDRTRPPGPLQNADSTANTVATDDTLQGGKDAQIRRQMLYIQMEFCPKTLRDVLDANGLTEAGRWTTLRQLLAGLQHLHAQGIIHRDLKPANLMFDNKGEIKLGDFGLAKFNNVSDPDEGVAVQNENGDIDLSDVTGVCGTSFYIDPYIEKAPSSALRYDERVDIFSLGIIVFEMWQPFSTAMERAVVLRDLRENGVLPPEFERQHSGVARLIRWLLSPNPLDRPTANDVLRSDLLPPTMGDEELKDLLRSLPDNPAAHDKVLDSLFALGGEEDHAAGRHTRKAVKRMAGAPAPDNHVPPEVRQRVIKALQEHFGRHGAVQMNSYDVGLPPTDVPEESTVHLLSRTGTRIALRGELRRPFAAWLASRAAEGDYQLAEGLRRWEIASVHHRGRGGGIPRPLMIADFDLIAPAQQQPAQRRPLAEAEAVCVIVDALDSLGDLNARWEVRLGHRALADAAMAHAGVPRELRPAALQLLTAASSSSPLHADARTKRWAQLRQGLEGLGVTKESIDRCKKYVLQGAGAALGSLHFLEAALGGSHTSTATNALNEIKSLLPLLSAWGVSAARVALDPFMSPQAGYYEGLLLQVYLVNEESGVSTAVAVGGRYDGLIKAYWARHAALSGIEGPPPAMYAMGMSVSVDRLATELAIAEGTHKLRIDSGSGGGGHGIRFSASDVLVCSRGGGGLLNERMELLKSLWDAGIAAETMLAEAPSMQAQFGFASQRNIPWLVVISKASFSANDTVRVKHLHSRLEEEVPVSELCRFLQSNLQPHSMSGRATPSVLRSMEDDVEEEGGKLEGQNRRSRRRAGVDR